MMYFPILRGRTFELIALRELLEKGRLGGEILPVIEPVKVSSSFIKTLDAFIAADRRAAVICNPGVGTWEEDLEKSTNAGIRDQFRKLMSDPHVLPAYRVNKRLGSVKPGTLGDSAIFVLDKPDQIPVYECITRSCNAIYTLAPDRSEYRRRLRRNRVVCEDHFPKKDRNVDYYDIEAEFFSGDHLYYKDDQCVGFSDYSIVGSDYNETGFAPYAIAIHIVYFEEDGSLYVAHFVSDSNDDIVDPANKFREAAGKLNRWNQQHELDTLGMRELLDVFHEEKYPGLGALKKYSIMHHLELMGRYLDEHK